MKTKKILIPVFTLSAALLLTACSGKEAADTTKTQTTQTEAGTEAAGTESGTKSGTETTGTSGTKLDDLYQQENQIFADHEDVWNKVFGMMNKSTADPSGNYADYLADTVDSNKDSFSEDELKTLTDDIETIRKIEEQIAELENDTTTSEDTDAENNSEARALYSAVQRGDISGMSFMFGIRDEEWENLDSDHPTRHIKDISTVVEVSAVTFPAYENTEINARCKGALDNARSALDSARQHRGTSVDTDNELALLKAKTEILGGF